ncbi:MAG: NAD(P)(+) transhydrogenase (Re/Si-specific) subunit beta [Myxococcales bacterium]|nr:NAD(P)(+) transhydrogenase (Re/Si-specific) subunit beta [Myxococcales bacterium]
MTPSILLTAYLVASVLFVFSLRGLSAQHTARRGNLLGLVGMIVAIGVTFAALLWPVPDARGGSPTPASPEALGVLGAAMGVGCLVGAFVASRVAMTAMPELVAILHSFVGLAAVLVGIGSHLRAARTGEALDLAHEIEVWVGVFVGAITFTGSVVAFGKLRGTIRSKPLLLPGRHALNAALTVACVALAVLALRAGGPVATHALYAMTALASVLGVHLVMAIGGGDMPVVVSLLNSYSGWAASAAGFMLGNDALIVTGALVGSSGAILSYIMCRAMNRSIWHVVFGGFGEGAGIASGTSAGSSATGRVREIDVAGAADLLLAARSVVIVPGYGMAVAQAQHALKEVVSRLEARGTRVRFAIHPVAGRLPGHMNVLLAEADISYEIVKEMDEIQEELPKTDVVVVIGANDIVNPSALEDPSSPIYGMPVLEAWRAGKVIMLKRSLGTGYAGVDNPLCYKDNTLMLFGDAKKSVLGLLAAIDARAESAAA